MGNGALPGLKRPGRVFDHPPHLAPRLKEEHIYTSHYGFRGTFWSEHYLVPVRFRGSIRKGVRFRRRAGVCWCVVDENRAGPPSAVT
jgi:hypothetical protein